VASQETIIVTGGAGFIGSNLIRYLLQHTEARVVAFDKLTYAGNLESLEGLEKNPRFAFEKGDIADGPAVEKVFSRYKPSGVLNLAAETHVDRSIDSPGDFIETNIVGTYMLATVALRYFGSLEGAEKKNFRLLHVSTDEVYGSLGPEGLFTEETPYSPNSPYSASKASADHLIRAYGETYGLPVLITNCSNNYGPFQFPEKLIPLMILNALEGKPLPIYGDGGNIRDWLYVEDHCAGIYQVYRSGRLGEKYNIGGDCELKNLQIVDLICESLERQMPASSNPAFAAKKITSYKELKTFVPDRPGHDRRYAIDFSKIERELGWRPAHNIETGLEETVRWYLENGEWCRKVQAGKYGRERLGTGSAVPGTAVKKEKA